MAPVPFPLALDDAGRLPALTGAAGGRRSLRGTPSASPAGSRTSTSTTAAGAGRGMLLNPSGSPALRRAMAASGRREAQMSAAALDNGLVRMDGPADPAAVERDLRCMEDIFEEELRRAAFRMADENDAGAISREECRTVLSSLAGGSEARRQAVASAVLPSQVDLEKFLRVASEVLA
eukprot:TRINITY_DN16054_c0_g1_i3.p2 TRINITY_DN16054_c0_g1~~TRINITY_DN16054_c0_g1_i3.p2  ORF type:complete len:178 (+),score=42.95 TRINITY_DN16054_c0_g1_i3:64-597(+)